MLVPKPPPIPVFTDGAAAVCVASGGGLGILGLGVGAAANILMIWTRAPAMLETISSPSDARASATDGVAIAGRRDV